MKTKYLHVAEATAFDPEGSFIGGVPVVPSNVETPICQLCSSRQTFFMRIKFPEGHLWQGHGLSVFYCVDCEDPDHLIPKIYASRTPKTKGINGTKIPSGRLIDDQINFSFLIDAGQLNFQQNRPPRIQLATLTGSRRKRGAQVSFVKPRWEMGDEAPAGYGNEPLFFLFDFAPFTFQRAENAPPQINWDWWKECQAPSSEPTYSLFVQNHLYFFGTVSPSNEIYCLVQVPGG